MSICADMRGRLFAGTEDNGVWMYDSAQPAGKEWTQFTTKNGLGDDNGYSLCCDTLGRIWAGSLDHGVSVFNGATWKNYDIMTGPLGSHVVALAVNPTNGDVWGATEAGLFRYREKQKDWRYTTRADGLPSDQASCLAFSKTGTIYVGTQCDGLAIADANAEHPKWRNVRGMDTLPLTASGNGLPTNLINCLLVTDDALWVGTTTGLACSKDGAKTFQYLRGKDYKAKIQGLITHPKLADDAPEGALAEDYVTCLVQSAAGALIVGHRQQAPELGTGTRFTTVQDAGEAYLTGIYAGVGADVIAHYGGGVTALVNERATREIPKRTMVQRTTLPRSFPSDARLPSATQFTARLKSLANTRAVGTSSVNALPDDWRTRGDWLGRYGRYWARLFAIAPAANYDWGAGPQTIHCKEQIGPNCARFDAARYWTHWRYTTRPSVLEMPMPYLHSRVLKKLTTWDQNRREAELDDHGEFYVHSLDGPDLYVTLTVPAGLYYLSLYDVNKDGHDGDNRFRDYRVSIRRHGAKDKLDDISDFDTQPELAHARICNFWGGLYKRFVVRGPLVLTVQIKRNYSLNTILPAIFLDPVDEKPTPYCLQRSELPAQKANGRTTSEKRRDVAADGLLDRLRRMRTTDCALWATVQHREYVELARFYNHGALQPVTVAASDRLGTCAFFVNLFAVWENRQRACGLLPARDIELRIRWDEATGGVSDYDEVFAIVNASRTNESKGGNLK